MRYIAICDDEPVHLEYTQSLVRKILPPSQFETALFSGAEPLLQAVEPGDYRPDIAVLDIRMEGADGIELARQLNRLVPECRIIFLSSFLCYATEVYETEHIYFVLKSEMERRLEPALRKAAEAPTAARCIRVKQAGGTARVLLQQILFLERKGRKTRVRTESEELWTTQTPQELLADLPGEAFIRCHQSYWVRTSRILALKNNDFCLPNEQRIPLSRTYRQQAKERFFASLKEPVLL